MDKILIENSPSLTKLSAEDPPLAEKIIGEWRREPKVRAEFRGNLESYVAYRKADAAGKIKSRVGPGLVRIGRG